MGNTGTSYSWFEFMIYSLYILSHYREYTLYGVISLSIIQGTHYIETNIITKYKGTKT